MQLGETALVEDVVKSLGYLCLGSRFRRIGERLQADTQQVIEERASPSRRRNILSSAPSTGSAR